MRKKSVCFSPPWDANRRLTAMVKEQTVTPLGVERVSGSWVRFPIKTILFMLYLSYKFFRAVVLFGLVTIPDYASFRVTM